MKSCLKSIDESWNMKQNTLLKRVIHTGNAVGNK